MVQYAKFETKFAYLSTDFGLEWTMKLFGAEVIADLPRYFRGPRAGKLKGVVEWRKVIVGGWTRDCGVQKPGVARARLAVSPYGTTISTMFDGRVQPIDFDRVYLFEEGRAKLAAERAANEARIEAEKIDESVK